MQVAMGLGKLVQFGFPLVFVWFVDRSQIGFPSFQSKGLILGVSFGLLAALAIFGLYLAVLRDFLLAGDTPGKIIEKLNELNCNTPLKFLLLAAFYSLLHSLLEEYYWRWFVFGWLRRYWSLWPAVVVSSLGFMAHHVILLVIYFPEHIWDLAVPFSLCVAIGGGVWAWLYERSKSIYALWISHLIVDAAIMAVGFDMVAAYLK